MSKLYCMITIADRGRLPEFIRAFRASEAGIELVTLGHGTAGKRVLDYLGLSGSEKAVVLSTATFDLWKKLKKEFERKIKIDVPGTGISFIVPMSSVGGARELALLGRGTDLGKGGESELKGTERELIVAVCNQGYSETVMDAAREAGAGGGTIIHAKGTGVDSFEKFLGFTLASEKDMILIVSKTQNRSAIMQAIMKNAGLETDAKAVSFSMPVTDAAGLRLLEDEEEAETAAPVAEPVKKEADAKPIAQKKENEPKSDDPYLSLEAPIPDLGKYLERIHCEDITGADLPALNRLIDSHTCHVPFENAEVYVRHRVPSLETEHLFDKIVTRGQGGYCFELNGLFEKLLQGLGFDAFGVAVRITLGKSFLPPVKHRAILVRLNGALYYADVGYGGPAPVTAILLDETAGWQRSGSRFYRAERENGTAKIYLGTDAGEELLFVLPTEPTPAVDFLAPNMMTAVDPESVFTQRLMVSRRTQDGHVSVNGNLLTVKSSGGEETRLLSEKELPETVKTYFGVVLN